MNLISRRDVIAVGAITAVVAGTAQAFELPEIKIDLGIPELARVVGEWVGDSVRFLLEQKKERRAESAAILSTKLLRLAGAEDGFADGVEQMAKTSNGSSELVDAQTRYLQFYIEDLDDAFIALQRALDQMDPNWAAKHPQLYWQVARAVTDHKSIYIATAKGTVDLSNKDAVTAFVVDLRADSKNLRQLALKVSSTLT